MQLADVTSALTTPELRRIVEDHGEPFKSAAQCEVFLRAAGMLWRRTPAEGEESGSRVVTRDLQRQMDEARKALGRFEMTSEGATVIVPPNDLR